MLGWLEEKGEFKRIVSTFHSFICLLKKIWLYVECGCPLSDEAKQTLEIQILNSTKYLHHRTQS